MMIQVPPLVSAKLPYCYSNDSNVVGAAFSAPCPPLPSRHPPSGSVVFGRVCLVFALVGLFGCCFALCRVWCDLLCLCYPPLPLLRREASGA